jgi:propionyl-CoA carboxylase alpha chain
MTTISTLLVANRGEIARRVMRTASDMGIRTVAVYSDGDVSAPFVREADIAVPLGGLTAAETYLDADKVLAAARTSGADGIHPGYGFLSENAAFAQAAVDAGFCWVGPTPSAIAAMGDKLNAKLLMERAGVPTLPSMELPEGADVSLAGAALGFPALVKASAGGGGKGMRIVQGPGELVEAVAAARREAVAAFGNGTVFLERYLTGARHVEMQILGDSYGKSVHLFERECSVQRRHQKVVEEAPCTAVGPELRERMGEAALLAAKAIDYENAGTVEFLLAEDGSFYFLEVNTRLQVEHPVTEMITGLDLVREQLLIAQGASLSFQQSDLTIDGHAVEARLYAEDPEKDFLPVTGTVLSWQPASSPEVRYDSGIESGSVIAVQFDPMLAKVVAHAPTRSEAVLRLALALERTVIQGTTTNRDFLVSVLRHPEFLAGATSTDFLERCNPARARTVSECDVEAAVVQAALAGAVRRSAAGIMSRFPIGWRNGALPPETFSFRYRQRTLDVRYRALGAGLYDVEVGPRRTRARVLACTDSQIEIELDGRRHRSSVRSDGPRWWVHGAAGDVQLQLVPRFPEAEVQAVEGALVAPLPGSVVAIPVVVGEPVRAGQLLVIVEAMKMEHRIIAPYAGAVSALLVGLGAQVSAGDLLVVLEGD